MTKKAASATCCWAEAVRLGAGADGGNVIAMKGADGTVSLEPAGQLNFPARRW
jgi:hypothetical protein